MIDMAQVVKETLQMRPDREIVPQASSRMGEERGMEVVLTGPRSRFESLPAARRACQLYCRGSVLEPSHPMLSHWDAVAWAYLRCGGRCSAAYTYTVTEEDHQFFQGRSDVMRLYSPAVRRD